MKTILAIDPGPEDSAYVIYDGEKPTMWEKLTNDEIIAVIEERRTLVDTLVVEQIAAMGMAVGAEVFETVFWSGRFCEAWGYPWERVKRHQVKMHLCGNMKAKDANIRQALIDRYGPGKDVAIGKKASPGPLYGMSGDCWAALAVAVTWSDLYNEASRNGAGNTARLYPQQPSCER